MADRGIIPGASREFSQFVATANDSPFSNTPDAGLGLLQSAFIFGYSFSILVAGHFVHRVPWKVLVCTGMSVWSTALILSGMSHAFNSYSTLLIARMMTGCAEAALHVVAPPMMQDRGGKYQGRWVSLYLTAAPVGLAIGYVYGSITAQHWEWAFFAMSGVSAPLLLILMCCIKDDSKVLPTSISSSAGRHFTFWKELHVCVSSRALVCVTIANAALVAVVSTLGTFGGAFLLALQLYDDEQTAAVCFGLAAALAGLIGTPVGGNWIDQFLSKQTKDASSHRLLVGLLPFIEFCTLGGIIFAWPTTIMNTPIPFLGFLFLGWVCMFSAQSGITMASMLSVDERYRPNALAFTTLFSHLLGDVPAPILFGLLKDSLAPACRIGKDGDFVDIDGCQSDHVGIRSTLAVAYAWMTWSLLFFELARYFARQQIRKENMAKGPEHELQLAGEKVHDVPLTKSSFA
eukprot:CAMPEP_0118696626 /NCGR_PEP_ID=MMETSP0800-20121206/13967_1 /TAXON_ID=210618 ORGANISM="Striatella unipunctata, Strain CCMP2910" /NCGR_SAMPLE_ID=MMETSP0800 /ASSEMBLY_ACC=CAM_ASM_000638 /LENGTH=459 /DNA_ID=CAMNT_0006595791 /DNA_START=344 /DNA_END=1723 /DNA_ORIENTATION=+